MKSKPPTKKIKIEIEAPPELNGSSTKQDPSPNVAAKIETVKASMAATASEIFGKLAPALLPVTPKDPEESAKFPSLLIRDLSKEFSMLPRTVFDSSSSSSSSSAAATEDPDNPSNPVEVISVEDTDILQQELEILWSDAAVRRRLISKEQERLFRSDQAEGTKVKGSSSSPTKPRASLLVSNVQRKSAILQARDTTKVLKTPNKLKSEDKTKRSLDKNSSSSSSSSSRGLQKRGSCSSIDGFSAFSVRQAPNQFWDFANGYCREVNEDDVELLEKMMEEQKLNEEIFNIPNLGPHFRESLSICTARASRDRIETRSKDVCGPLTQRVVAALVDSRIAAFRKAEDGLELLPESLLSSEGSFLDRPDLLSTLGLDTEGRGSQPLEIRLRQVLVEQGLLIGDEAECTGDDPRDEILTDIKKTQHHLAQLHQHNSDWLNHLYALAKKEMERVDAKLDLERADRELLDAYRVISSSRTKKKPLSKREREVAVRALENRRVALDRLLKPPEMPESHSTNSNFAQQLLTTVGGPKIEESVTQEESSVSS